MNRTPANPSAAFGSNHEDLPTRGNGAAQAAAPGGALAQFAAQRAHGLVDALHALARQGIDDAQRSLAQAGVDSLWRSSRPLVRGTGEFIAHHPWRTGAILALLVGAALLTRTPGPSRS